MKISGQIDEQKILMLSSWGKSAASTSILRGSREPVEVRAAVNNTTVHESQVKGHTFMHLKIMRNQV